MSNEICIAGAGGMGRELAWLAQQVHVRQGGPRPVAFVEQPGMTGPINGLPCLTAAEAAERFPGAAVAVGIGDPRQRERILGEVAAAGLDWRIRLIHPDIELSPWVEVGEGTVICAGSVLTTNIRLGACVQINLACTITHDVVMEDYVTLAPGVHVSGRVHIGRGAFLGTGSVVINGVEGRPLSIGAGAVVGAGACVTRDVPPGVTVVGVPARPLAARPTLR